MVLFFLALLILVSAKLMSFQYNLVDYFTKGSFHFISGKNLVYIDFILLF